MTAYAGARKCFVLSLLLVVTQSTFAKENVFCQPYPVVTPTDSSGHFKFFPFYIALHQCQGSVPPTSRPSTVKCVNASHQIVTVNVSILETQQQVSLKFENHTECASACVLTGSECNSFQTWSADTCSCECTYAESRIATPHPPCPPRRKWSPGRCDCVCESERPCSGVKVWNNRSCTCECPEDIQKSCKPPSSMDHDTCICIKQGKTSSPSTASGTVSVGWLVVALVADAIIVASACAVCFKLYNRRIVKPWLQRHFSRPKSELLENANSGRTSLFCCGKPRPEVQV